MQAVFKRILKYLFSTVGLCFLILIYCIIGAWMFAAIEGGHQWNNLLKGQQRAQHIETERKSIRDKVWTLMQGHKEEEQLFQRYDQDYLRGAKTKTEMLILYARRKYRMDQIEHETKRILDEYHKDIADAIQYYNYDGTVPTELFYSWTFPSALIFTLTCLGTIGYGRVVPVTELGKFILIPFCIFGIPLTLIFLANIGAVFADGIRIAYNRGCCRFCKRKREANQKLCNPRRSTSVIGPDDSRNSTAGKHRSDSLELTVITEEVLDENIPTDGPLPVPVTLSWGIVGLYVFAGGLVFHFWIGWTITESCYFSFVTLATVGFGDYVPGFDILNTTEGKLEMIAAFAYIFIGLSVLTMGINLLIIEILTRMKRNSLRFHVANSRKCDAALSDSRPHS